MSNRTAWLVALSFITVAWAVVLYVGHLLYLDFTDGLINGLSILERALTS